MGDVFRKKCPVQMEHDPGVFEMCRRDARRPHEVHVSENGYYRWLSDGELIETPHWASEEFAALYRDGLPT